ncbi:hypothetical protein OXYTRIMIC_073 [Oxytricha trifallax]|uniref:Uncharacterized protein n=1 Tax=Oxytricha trifallax TaxID=1172189 RepID=A0A073ICE7_9SPIT|nr:hypothetical protein OXYTRIMIC_073 [Oxytricha trifallax]
MEEKVPVFRKNLVEIKIPAVRQNLKGTKAYAVRENLKNLKSSHFRVKNKFKHMSDSIKQTIKMELMENQIQQMPPCEYEYMKKDMVWIADQELYLKIRNLQIDYIISELEKKTLPENIIREFFNIQDMENQIQDAMTFILQNEEEYDYWLKQTDTLFENMEILPSK